MTIKPRNDRVLIRPDAAETVTPGGLYIPENAQEKPTYAEVVAVGPGLRDANGIMHPLDIEPGDRVLFGKYSGTAIKDGGDDLIMVRESDILARIVSG